MEVATGLIAVALLIVRRKIIWMVFAIFGTIVGLAALTGGIILAMEHA